MSNNFFKVELVQIANEIIVINPPMIYQAGSNIRMCSEMKYNIGL